MGRLKKGGVPDQMIAARIVLNDWNTGKIKYFTYPPDNQQSPSIANDEAIEEAEIVCEFAKEFSLDDFNITKMESDDMGELPNILPSQTTVMQSTGVLKEIKTHEEIEHEEMSENKTAECHEDKDKENLLSTRISISVNTHSIKDDKKVTFK